MLTVYPSNRLEVLSKLLEALLKERKGSVLSPDTILVESRGMQHWLNMQLAESMGVAMNLAFPMPTRFIWEIAQTVLDPKEIPQYQLFKREVLAWRIDDMFATGQLSSDDGGGAVARYWGGGSEVPDPLKRFQLATRLADVLEQYMMFRPDWLEAWAKGEQVEELNAKPEAQWQAEIWRLLIAEESNHPAELQQKAIVALQQGTATLPEQVFIFAINTIAPQTLAFFEAIAQHTDVHLFHLNPCVSFWGDQQTDKALARQLRQQQLDQWIKEEHARNPLLANLGQQGKALFNLLQDKTQFEISAFVDPLLAQSSGEASQQDSSLLHKLQADILQLNDATVVSQPIRCKDDSIVISSSHSALREIQSLHDYLLHQFNSPTNHLSPQDVLVMCPAIEEYAPYIDAVFRRPWEQQGANEPPRLPCSIADRTMLDSEPLVNAFMDLLSLPDSRFEVSKILDYLRLPALQNRFGIGYAELEKLEWWLREAAVHWGLNPEHKAASLGMIDAKPTFTWQWGLKRLLKGYAQGDNEWIGEDGLLLPHVEGQDAVLLGRLMQLLERLQSHTRELTKSRSPKAWQRYLLTMLEEIFAPDQDDSDAIALIVSVIGSLAEHCRQAGYDAEVALSVVRFYLSHHFSQPDSGNHFMTGQITFCSMVPMRSIPFKVIAILGLNDGQFPRQSIPISFDLMAHSTPRAGDRSRRSEDRYLFLEALISVRDKLYLSYQGRDIRKNSERQPSLVLKELMNYLEKGCGWRLDPDEEHSDLRQSPLHPFSDSCFQGDSPSFDSGWLGLDDPQRVRDNVISLPPLTDQTNELSVNDLVVFFDNPLKLFGQQRLGLYLEGEEEILEDAEPFSSSKLLDYQINQSFIESRIDSKSLDALKLRYELSGQLPETPYGQLKLAEAEQRTDTFYRALKELGEYKVESVSCQIGQWMICAEFRWLATPEDTTADDMPPHQVLYRPGKRRAKFDVQLWLMHLMATVIADQPIQTTGVFLTDKAVEKYGFGTLVSVEQATEWLLLALNLRAEGLNRPLLAHCDLAKSLYEGPIKYVKDKEEKSSLIHQLEAAINGRVPDSFGALASASPFTFQWQKTFEEAEDSDFHFARNHYFTWFYPSIPEITRESLCALSQSYWPLYQQLTKVG